jgi:hypothetical protein
MGAGELERSGDEGNASFQLLDFSDEGLLDISDEGLPLAEVKPGYRPDAGGAGMAAASPQGDRLSPSKLAESSGASLVARISSEGRRTNGDTGSKTAE